MKNPILTAVTTALALKGSPICTWEDIKAQLLSLIHI